MKKGLLFIVFLGAILSSKAQVPFVSIQDINYVSPANLVLCNDTSAYYNDTVITVGIVVVAGNLSEVASGTVPGGSRPFIFIVDTASNGVMGNFNGLEVMGTNVAGSLSPPPTFTQVVAGDIVQIKGVINAYNNGNQISLLDANSFSVIGTASAPTPTTMSLGDLNDPNRINNVATGEEWEGSFVKIENVTVANVIYFSGNSRISFDVVDAFGNRMNVSDRFLAQKLPSWSTVNPNSPQATGSFTPPVNGTFYTSISGMVRHDGNGCTGGTGRGYELNPFDSTHYEVGFAPPLIANFDRDPLIPTSNQSVDITCNITDFDGSVDSVAIAWTDNAALTPDQFPKYKMNLTSGSTDEYEYTIPNKPDGTQVRYYVYAVDNDTNESYYPQKPISQTMPNAEHYYVRNNGAKVFDIQFTSNPSGASPLEGKTVTVTGIVTASTKLYDLGYVYIQDEGGAEWSGIWCVGIGLSSLYRDEEVTVTGIVEEYFGFTRLNVSSATKTGNRAVITPTVIDPTDSAAYANFGWEKWEGVYARYEHPTAGQKLWISQPNLGFGDYAVGASSSAPISQSGRILAGRQATTAYSSLFVQLIVDTTNFNYAVLDGFMNVPPIVVNNTMNMDAVDGIIFYGFNNFRLLPRNNDDFIGINVNLDSTNLPTSPIAIDEFEGLDGLRIYPNPAQQWVSIAFETEQNFTVRIMNTNGQLVLEQTATQTVQLDLGHLSGGLYIISLENEAGNVHHSKLIITK